MKTARRYMEDIEIVLSNTINYSDYRHDFTCRVAEARKR